MGAQRASSSRRGSSQSLCCSASGSPAQLNTHSAQRERQRVAPCCGLHAVPQLHARSAPALARLRQVFQGL